MQKVQDFAKIAATQSPNIFDIVFHRVYDVSHVEYTGTTVKIIQNIQEIMLSMIRCRKLRRILMFHHLLSNF